MAKIGWLLSMAGAAACLAACTGRATVETPETVSLTVLVADADPADDVAAADTDGDAMADSVADAVDAAPEDVTAADAAADATVADAVDAVDAGDGSGLEDTAEPQDAADAAGDAADGAQLSDVADAADVPVVPDVADTVDASSDLGPQDAGPDDAGPADAGGVCFKGGPPSADAYVADIPATDPATCPVASPPSTWFSGPVPAPKLLVTAGYLGDDGQFHAYADKDWAPIIYGMQGSFHIWAAFEVSQIPDMTSPSVALDTQVWAETECTLVASGLLSKANATQTTAGVYTNVAGGNPGIPTQFYVPAAAANQYCGVWVDLHIRLHDPTSGAWGETVRTLRLYDSKP